MKLDAVEHDRLEHDEVEHDEVEHDTLCNKHYVTRLCEWWNTMNVGLDCRGDYTTTVVYEVNCGIRWGGSRGGCVSARAATDRCIAVGECWTRRCGRMLCGGIRCGGIICGEIRCGEIRCGEKRCGSSLPSASLGQPISMRTGKVN